MDTTYRVILNLSTTGDLTAKLGDVVGKADLAQARVASLGSTARTMGDSVASMGARIGDTLGSAADRVLSLGASLAKVGAAAGVAALTYGVANLNTSLESTEISLGAIFNAQGFASSFPAGMKMATDQLAKMKQDVKSLPGDLGQLSDIMKTIATPAAQGHAGADDIRRLAGRTMLVGTILGVQQDVAGREMAGLLAGRAGSHNILGTRLGFVGDAAKALNAMGQDQRFATIGKELDKYGPAAERFGQAAIAQWTTLKDNVKYGFLANATAPLFDHVKASLGDINGWFGRNQPRIDHFTHTIGDKLASAWDTVANAVARVEPLIERMAQRLEKLSQGDALALLGKVLGTGAAMKMLPGGLSLGSRAMGPLLETIGGGAGLGAGLGESALVAAPALAALAVAIGATVGAIHDLTDATSDFHITATKQWDHLTANVGDGLERMGDAMKPMMPLFDLMGSEVLNGINNVSYAFLRFGESVDWVTHKLEPFIKWAAEHAPGYEPARQMLSFERDRQMLSFERGERADAKKPTPRDAPNQTFKVEIVVKGSDDPSRIARLTKEALLGIARNPTSGRRPNFALPRGGT